MQIVYLLSIALSAAALSWAGTLVAIWGLRWVQLMDKPNERSNHARLVPRGAGIALMLSALSFLLVGGENGGLIWGALALTVVSFIDDMRGLSALPRLLSQIIVVALTLKLIGPEPVFQGHLPLAMDHLLAALLWLWAINLTNFMDGIDGITGTETMCIGMGIVLLGASIAGFPRVEVIDGAVLTAAAGGFLLLNWQPAKIFMGDSGSVPLGYLLGYLLLRTAAHGEWQAALILPAYYFLDASLTLARRILTGQRPWEAHSQHFYQQSVRGGRSHADTVRWIFALNLMLMALAIASVKLPDAATTILIIAYALACALAIFFARTRISEVHAPAAA